MNNHDHDDPMSTVSMLDAVMEAALTVCPTCQVKVEVIPASGTRHVLGITHEEHCDYAVLD